jgi:hypothetical protein
MSALILSANTTLMTLYIQMSSATCFGRHHDMQKLNGKTIQKNLKVIWHSEDRAASRYILTIKDNKMHYFSNLFWQRTQHVSDRSTVHHQESQHCIHSNRYLSCCLCWLDSQEVRMEHLEYLGLVHTFVNENTSLVVYVRCIDWYIAKFRNHKGLRDEMKTSVTLSVHGVTCRNIWIVSNKAERTWQE